MGQLLLSPERHFITFGTLYVSGPGTICPLSQSLGTLDCYSHVELLHLDVRLSVEILLSANTLQCSVKYERVFYGLVTYGGMELGFS